MIAIDTTVAWRHPTGLAAVVLGLATVFGPFATHAEEPLKVQGATTFDSRLLQPYQQEIEEMAGVKIVVVGSKSVWGVLALLEGRADVAMISADLDGEISVARMAAPELPFDRLVNFPVSRTRVAFAVHPSNPVRKLKLEAVRRLLLGPTNNWHDIGGAKLPIRVVAVQDGGGSVVAVRTQVLGGLALSADNTIRLESPRHVIKVVQQEPAAFGITQLGLLQAAGLPEIETDHPVEQQLNLVTLGPATPRIQAFLDAARSVAAARLK